MNDEKDKKNITGVDSDRNNDPNISLRPASPAGLSDEDTSYSEGNNKEIAKLKRTPKKIDEDAIALIPEEVAKKYQVAAFEKKGDAVKIAMVDTGNISALNALRFMSEKEGVKLEVYSATQEIFDDIMRAYNGPAEVVKAAVQSFNENIVLKEAANSELEENDSSKRDEILKDAPVSKLVQIIISHAIQGRASDIHIEPMDKDYRVRFRVDGVLHINLVIPKAIGPAVLSRIKILANLKIDEKRKPQDGRFRTINNGKEIDFRVSTLPVISGEKVVMRILDKDQGLANVESLGLMGTALEDVKKSIEETYGMILFTGPTGSGKSTSLYSLLKILNNEERNIITLEDPIEYNLEGLNQSQIRPEIGYTFASGLRTILRQDPNVIMVGEIRDSETAELAVHAALTGHLMFSTLHTNTALGAIPRLIDMGIEPFLLASALRIVVAQRLVRRICSNCKEEKEIPASVRSIIEKEIQEISPEELKKYKIDPQEKLKFFHGKGCDVCNGTGTKGRVAIYEAVLVNDNIRTVITEKDGAEELLQKEREKRGVLTIKQDGILKIVKGLTTIEEVDRVTEGNITLEEGII